MFRWIGRLTGDQRGATAVEYGLILALIFLAIVGAVKAVAGSTIDVWNNVTNKVSNSAAT